MSHFISGIIGSIDLLKSFSRVHNLHNPSNLPQELGFLPLSAEHIDSIFPINGQFSECMTYHSEALHKALQELSIHSPVAYIETDYFGGIGEQGAAAYKSGLCIYGPISNESTAISEALKILGVKKKTISIDEFDTIELHRHRENDDWIEEANPS